MLVVETIARIRREHLGKGTPIRKLVRDLKVARNTVRKVVRSDETSAVYARTVQPRPKLGPWIAELERRLEADEKKQRRDRLSYMRLYEELAALGYEGGYDAVRRYARDWCRRRRSLPAAQAYVPLSFDPGEAYQFDWSHEYAILSGVTTKVKAAHMRLCHSRMQLVQIFPREGQEMVFEAHERAFEVFGGVCRRGIYDNMKTAVSTVFVGKKRDYNRRFQEMCSHHLVEPVACTPGAGWEKGQVERQVDHLRGRLFVPRPRGKSYAEINAWLMDQCIRGRQAAAASVDRGQDSVAGVRGRTALPDGVSRAVRRLPCRRGGGPRRPAWYASTTTTTASRRAPSDGRSTCGPMPRGSSSARTARPSPSIPGASRAARSPTTRGTMCRSWRGKPGALRNGAPFKDWQLPGALGRMRAWLAGRDDGDRQVVKILAAVQEDGLDAVEAACAEALDNGACSADVVLNILARQRQPAPPAVIPTPEGLQLRHPPAVDCRRYDRLREAGHGAS